MSRTKRTQVVLWAIAAAALAGAVAIAPNCDAPDVLQAVMLFVLPPVVGVSAGAALAITARSRAGSVAGVVVGVGAAGGAWLIVLVLWLGRCTA